MTNILEKVFGYKNFFKKSVPMVFTLVPQNSLGTLLVGILQYSKDLEFLGDQCVPFESINDVYS